MGDGERGRNRTYNLLIKSQLLCQLSYAPFNHVQRWRGRLALTLHYRAGRVCLAAMRLFPPGCIATVRSAVKNNIIAVKDRTHIGFADSRCNSFRHASVHEVAHRRAPQIVND